MTTDPTGGWTRTVTAGLGRVGGLVRKTADRIVKAVWDYRPVWTPRRLHLDLEAVPVDRPIFVLGTQGAGLTLLTRMMRRNPSVVTIGGGPSFWAGNDEMDKHPVGHRQWPDALALRSPGYDNMTGREVRHPVFGYERSWVYATDELLGDYRLTAEDWTPDLEAALRERLRWAIRGYARDPGCARFLDMSQSFSLKVPFLLECFEDARFVAMTRNPYVMCWREINRNTAKYRGWAERPGRKRALELAAQHWSNTYATLLADLEEAGRGLTVRYEEFTESPEQTLRCVLDHVELSFEADMLPRAEHRFPIGSKERGKWHPVRQDANRPYLESIPDVAIELLTSRIGELAAECGYRPPGEDRP